MPFLIIQFARYKLLGASREVLFIAQRVTNVNF